MLVATRGIVLKSHKFQESSLIVKLFTESHGVQTFMVKGVRSVKANGKAAMFQSGMLLDFIMYYQENKSFKMFKEYKAAYVYDNAIYEIRKSSILMFLIEVIEQCIHADNEDDQLFNFIFTSLQELDKQTFNPDFHLYFLLHFMQHLGIYPSANYTENLNYFDIKEGCFTASFGSNPFVLNQEDSGLIVQLLNKKALQFNRQQRKKAIHLLLDYYNYHIENFKGVKSLQVLETVLS